MEFACKGKNTLELEFILSVTKWTYILVLSVSKNMYSNCIVSNRDSVVKENVSWAEFISQVKNPN